MPTISAEAVERSDTLPLRARAVLVRPVEPMRPATTPTRLLRVTVSPIQASERPFRPAEVIHQDGHAAKRTLDIVIALIALLIFLPVILIVAVAVKLSSPGAIFFRQERVGRNGELFNVIKFRSMRSGTHSALMSDELARRRYQHNDFKLDADDPRITWIGRIIRATSLDELPQLLNVIKGDMSLVGIRPLLEMEVALRSHYDQECYRAMRPGMTGLWQVSGRSSVAHDSRHALDRRYIETWNVTNDLKLLARTPIAMLQVGNTR